MTLRCCLLLELTRHILQLFVLVEELLAQRLHGISILPFSVIYWSLLNFIGTTIKLQVMQILIYIIFISLACGQREVSTKSSTSNDRCLGIQALLQDSVVQNFLSIDINLENEFIFPYVRIIDHQKLLSCSEGLVQDSISKLFISYLYRDQLSIDQNTGAYRDVFLLEYDYDHIHDNASFKLAIPTFGKQMSPTPITLVTLVYHLEGQSTYTLLSRTLSNRE